MTEQEVYQEVGQLLWSLMPQEAKIIFYTGTIYPEHNSWLTTFILRNSDEVNSFGFEESLQVVELKILDLMGNLQKITNGEKWTHFTISLDENAKFKIDFAYIPEEDSWTSLHMKGISDLTKEEVLETAIPLELWEERVKLKTKK
ncbi:immunity protein YezG family protein [Acinetobacter sp. HY1485]|uniref:immunity protein YezG family protein n=1 Tax=Acinetobacter sp. HY1485 TaxID=2970918 RepID=UPI0022B999E1|nr:immunity protein YezG family protein [Acinetobacter sp. HY1485]